MWRTALFLLSYAAAAAQDYDPSEAGGRARMYALLDAMVTAALSDDDAHYDHMEERLEAARFGTELTPETERHADLVRNASQGDSWAMLQVGKTFCSAPPPPNATWCERIVRVAAEMYSKEFPRPEVLGVDDPSQGDRRPGAAAFYLGTQHDLFTPWWLKDDLVTFADRDNCRCLPASETRARQWYAQAAFRGHSAAAFNLFFIHANRGNDDKKDRALAKHWLDEAVKLGEPAAVNVRARKAGLSVSAFLAENARLWGDDAALVERRTRVLLAENGIDADAVPPSPGDVWPPALAPTPAPRPRTVASSDAGAGATSSDKKAGPFAGFRKRFGGGAKGEEL